MKKRRFTRGFSLAEALFTMTVIGIISSLVIPVLIVNIQNSTLRASWKEAYSIINRATTRIKIDNGGTLNLAFQNTTDLMSKYAQYLVTTKLCSDGEALGNCWFLNNSSSYWLLGAARNDWWNNAGMILNNGMMMLIRLDDASCNATFDLIPKCATIYLDVNGFKAPNTIGRDIYPVHLTKDGIKPYGITGDSYSPLNDCADGTAGSGRGCAEEFLTH